MGHENELVSSQQVVGGGGSGWVEVQRLLTYIEWRIHSSAVIQRV